MAFRDMFRRFQQECETSDHHKENTLQTHYYKASVDHVFQSVESLIKANGYTIQTVSKEHGEIMAGKGKVFLVSTILVLRPFEVAVDFKLTTDKGSLTGAYPKLRGEIEEFYKMLDKDLTLVKR
ncbi:hypothetical protein Q75_11400 [Bacillus coahuilensis p1.1.43]|uniref:Cytosolic protein n=1 Tax=Bacillus coahuilensis p1.1.43 TaxID=1150625 RepID=A0A147K6N5_9BACI|nr:hypothetical protein [Bacillus coahuilensis]KUP05565.1 hypothetical protein Q75_11400 [Bacillus coahuilensis p1.1.43]